jgi:hypothetical protein
MEITETLSHEAQIDTQLAEAHTSVEKHIRRLDTPRHQLLNILTKGMRYDERKIYSNEATLQQLVDRAQKLIEDGAPAWILNQVDEAFETIRTTQAAIAALRVEIETLEDQYTGWSRFFLVNNTNGHIHSSLSCSTCHITTSFSWLPTLSGLTEADAVEAHGCILCSVCFPTAPVSWTDGISKVAQAAKDAKAAEKAAKDEAKAAKAITAADGSPLRTSSYGEIKTEVTARRELTSSLENKIGYGTDRYDADIELLVSAIAAKTGEDKAELLAAAKAKAAKKIAKEWS